MIGSKNYRRAALLASLLASLFAALLPVAARAQSAASAFGPGKSWWAGAEYANFSSSFPYQSGQRVAGVGVFVDYHLNSRLSLGGEARFLRFGGFENSTETTWLAGPKLFVFDRKKFRPYGKLLAGLGRIQYPFAIGPASYFALAPGAGVEYRVTRRFAVQVGYEYQLWFNSPGYASQPDHRLTPSGLHVGLAYRLLR